ncbi:MAG: hypothetical protein HC945_01610 [Nitrosarchaeum sp.]|nr:hypothetical protein [Nitrosarchaeum sp.]
MKHPNYFTETTQQNMKQEQKKECNRKERAGLATEDQVGIKEFLTVGTPQTHTGKS